MNKITTTIFAALIAGAFALTACGGSKDEAKSDKCAKAVDHTMTLSLKMAKDMAGAMGDKGKEVIAKAEKEIKAKTPEAIKSCQESLKKEPEKVGKLLDCMIGAKDIQGLQACEGVNDLMK